MIPVTFGRGKRKKACQECPASLTSITHTCTLRPADHCSTSPCGWVSASFCFCWFLLWLSSNCLLIEQDVKHTTNRCLPVRRRQTLLPLFRTDKSRRSLCRKHSRWTYIS